MTMESSGMTAVADPSGRPAPCLDPWVQSERIDLLYRDGLPRL